MPRWAQSIRFRLSLAYSLAVLACGTVLLAGLYMWQVSRLDEPQMVESRQIVFEDSSTGAVYNTRLRLYQQDELEQAFLAAFERQAYVYSLDQLRTSFLYGLPILFVVAFGTGWLLAGWTLQPVRRMAGVAREISGTELSRRIGLQGPDDELKQMADTFDAMLDRLQASFEGQRRFVQEASHELRNPLAVTQANLELAIDDPDATVDDLRRAATVAHSSTGRLSLIVDDLVRQAREEVPAEEPGTVDLTELSADIAAEFQASAARRNLTLESHTRSTSPVLVTGDDAALRRAVTNLVVNAVRLAPEGSTITIETGTDQDLATVSVGDEGPGIAPEQQEAVFERFWRGDEGDTGLGLGLSIVRQVAERHGGRVELESRLDRGSTFTIKLPMPVAPSRNGS